MLLFVPFLRKLIQRGCLTVIDAKGRSHIFAGAPADDLTPVTIRLHDPSLHWRIALQTDMAAGEAYMDGTLTIEEGTLYEFLYLACENFHLLGRATPWQGINLVPRRIQQWNPISFSRRRVAHHYDLSEAFYTLFLDRDRQYSCAYFSDPDMTLEAAQTAKKNHLMAKLLLQPGHKVLDIGSGWGGMGLSIARNTGAEVTGITLSEEQLAVARRRAEEAGLPVRFLLTDYRQLTGQFDRIISVGMFEHVGVAHYPTYFQCVRRLLKEDGVAVIHAIGRSDGPGSTSPWMRKYIFPGGYSPALSEVLPAVERAGLTVTDIEILRTHYADTIRHWRARFTANRDKAVALYDERFCRMWEFYLVGAETAFRCMGHMIWQLQLACRPDTVPRTRDYIHDVEQTYPQS